MTLIETCLVVIAVAAAVFALGVGVSVLRVLPLLARMDTLIGHANVTVERVNGIATEIEGVARDARRLESRIATTLGGLLDEVEPPLRTLTAVLSGARGALAAIFERGQREAADRPATRPEGRLP